MSKQQPLSRAATDVPSRSGSSYPEVYRAAVEGRSKRALGDVYSLTAFGVNHVELAPGSCSAQRHWHTHEDEFVYVLSGEITLLTDNGEELMRPGDMAAFKAGVANGHLLRNDSKETVVYLEVGNRDNNDAVLYPDIDLELRPAGDGKREFRRHNGDAW